MRKTEFPLIVQKGHAIVKIYRVKDRDGYNYTVAYNKRSGRVKKTFADFTLANREANKVAQDLAAGDMEALKLTGADRQIYVEAERAIAPTGLPLHSVVARFSNSILAVASDRTRLKNKVDAAVFAKVQAAFPRSDFQFRIEA